MGETVLSYVLTLIHLLATVAWIGGMITNFLVYLPAIRQSLEPPAAGKLMGSVMRRYRGLVYVSMILLLVSGIGSGWLQVNTGTESGMDDPWVLLIMAKVIVFVLMAVLALFAFEVLAPKAARLAKSGPSPQLAAVQQTQARMAFIGLILGLIILLLSAAL